MNRPTRPFKGLPELRQVMGRFASMDSTSTRTTLYSAPPVGQMNCSPSVDDRPLIKGGLLQNLEGIETAHAASILWKFASQSGLRFVALR